MKFIKLDCIEVGNLEGQVRRNYEWHTDGDTVNDILDVVHRTRGDINLNSFTGIATDALTLSTDSESVYMPGIDNNGGLRERRFRFLLEVELEPLTQYNRKRTRCIVQGYTDHADLSMNDLVDPKMRMYMNNITTVQDFMVKSRRGGTELRTHVIDSSQTILGDLAHGAQQGIMMRPSDIFARIENDDDILQGDGDYEEVIDSRSSFHSGVQLNDRRVNAAGNYLSKLIGSDIEASANIETLDPTSINITRDAIAYDSSGGSFQTARSNRFLRALTSMERTMRYKNYFTYQDMIDYMDIPDAVLDRDVGIFMNDDLGEMTSDNWGSATAEVKAATQLCHIVPIIMFDCHFTSITFTADNSNSRVGECDIVIIDATCTLGDNVDSSEIITAFKSRLRSELFGPISNHGHQRVSLYVDCEAGGVTSVDISIDSDEEEYHYTFTSFADSFLAPVYTERADKATDLSDGYSRIRDQIDSTVRDSKEIMLSTDIRAAQRAQGRATERTSGRTAGRGGRHTEHKSPKSTLDKLFQ